LKHTDFHASIRHVYDLQRQPKRGVAVRRLAAVKGESLTPTPALSVTHSDSIALPILPSQTGWRLLGVPSHVRYVERAERSSSRLCRRTRPG